MKSEQPYRERVTTRMPRSVLALRFTGNFDAIEQFVGGDAEFRGGELVVATRQGPLRARSGDWIVRDGDRFTSYPPHLFADAFEQVADVR